MSEPQKNSYQAYHQALIKELIALLTPLVTQGGAEDEALQALYQEKLASVDNPECSYEEREVAGQWLLTRIVSHHQDLMPAIPRDLFWYFGGDCLHFLGDDEIDVFQKLNEAYFTAEASPNMKADYAALKTQYFAMKEQGSL